MSCILKCRRTSITQITKIIRRKSIFCAKASPGGEVEEFLADLSQKVASNRFLCQYFLQELRPLSPSDLVRSTFSIAPPLPQRACWLCPPGATFLQAPQDQPPHALQVFRSR